MRPVYIGLALLAACGNSGDKDTNKTPNGSNSTPTAEGATLQPDPAYEATVLSCSATGVTDADGDSVTLVYGWFVNGEEVEADTDTLSGSFFDRDDEVVCTVTPTDDGGAGAAVTSNAVTIQNTAPRGISVDVTPAPGTVLDALIAVPTGWSDDDGDDELWRYDWYVNGTEAGDGSDTLSSGYVKGDQVYVIVTPDDRIDLGDPIQSDFVDIVNSAPELSSAEVTPFSPFVNHVLVCTPLGDSDADGDIVSFNYEWFVDGAAAGTGTDLLVAPNFSRDQEVFCRVTPTDGEDDGTPVDSNTVTIQNSPPSIASVTLTPDPATETTTLTCAGVGLVDADGDLVNLSVEWTVGGLAIAATGFTLNGSNFNRGQAVRCTITPDDGTTTGAAVASNVVVISNSPPTATLAVVSPSTPFTTDDVSAVLSGWSDADGDPAGYQYQWLVDGVALAGETASTLSAANYVKHNMISVEATPDDGIDLGPIVVSAEVEVANTPPTAPQVLVNPDPPDTSDTLVCSIAVGATDVDGDFLTYSYTWELNGVVSVSHTTNTVPASDTAFGDLWECLAVANDGEADGPVGRDLVNVTDNAAPDSPLLDQVQAYRNDTEVTLTGTTEGNATVTLYATCDGVSSGEMVTNADPNGDFSFDFTMAYGEYCDFYVVAEDAQGNLSGDSNIVDSFVCADPDLWEDAVGSGNTSADPIDAFPDLADDGLDTFLIEGNILADDIGDWFVVRSTDNNATDLIAGRNDYDFHVELTAGIGNYTFQVYKSDVGSGDLECAGQSSGYDDYNDYQLDAGDAPDHSPAVSPEACATNSSSLNECTNMTNTYYIKVIHNPLVSMDCTPYEITVTNGLP